MKEQRPNPDKLLQRAKEIERQGNTGKLKIYLGAAPGVGKTHEMLHDALNEREKGLDVVAGIIESHGRKEIDAMLQKIEVLPRLMVDYHGTKLGEFDLDGALKRHPALILIDEMAHTNPPDFRHKKRWQDIKELLERGINVCTTLNVQHIESLNDDVSQILHIRIKEIVPDAMIEMADTIELVDLPPEELLDRLHEGKVYFPAQANIASENFFRKGNLIALRELALRATANQVNTQVLLYRQDKGIKHIWPTREKILVCVGPGIESTKLIRTAKNLATSLQAEWIAVYIDSPQTKFAIEKRKLAVNHLHMAERLGAETLVLTGFNKVKEIINLAQEQNVTQIVIWKHIRKRWQSLFFRSLADEIIRASGEINVYVVTKALDDVTPTPKITLPKKEIFWKGYGIALVIISLATLINYVLFPYLSAVNLIMIYLLSITAVALLGRGGSSFFAAILSIVAYNFFFLTPYLSFKLHDGQYVVTLLIMLVISQILSHLILLVRHKTEISRFTEHQSLALYKLTRQLASTRGTDKLLHAGLNYIAEAFGSDVIALLPKDNHLAIRARCRTEKNLDEKEKGIAEWVYELGQKAGLGTDSLSFSDALYLPLLGSQGPIGVLRIHPAQPENLTSSEKMHVLETCTNQIALALEVDRLQDKSHKSKLRLETDRVRSALLKAVSHDLREPVVAIMGLANTQIEAVKNNDVNNIAHSAKNIYFEAEQLNRLINNLLQITYLEAEKVILKKQLLSLKSIINDIIDISKKKLSQHQLEVNIPDDLPPIPFDETLLSEVFINLLDNAVKFTEVNTLIEISVSFDPRKATVQVLDHGPGIMPDEVTKLFEKFYRGQLLAGERGLGLGLAICQRIIAAHGGEIWAENAKEGGAIFIFTLPFSNQI